MNWKIMKRVTAILLTILLVMSNMALVWADDSNGDEGEPIAEEHLSAVSMTGYVLPDGTPAFMDEDGNYPEEAVATVDLENNAVTWYIKIEAKEGSVYPLTNVLLRDDWGQYAVNNWQMSGNLVADRCLDYEGAVVIGETTGQVYMPGTDYTAAQEIRVETSAESGEEIEVGGPIEFAFPAITEPIIVAMTATFPVELEGNCNFTNGISVLDLDYYGYTGASADIVYTPSKPDDPEIDDPVTDDPESQIKHTVDVAVTGYTLPDGTPAFRDEDGNYPEEAVSTVNLDNNTVTWYIKIGTGEDSEYPLNNLFLRDDWGQYAVNNWQTSGNIVADRCLDYEGAVVIGETTGQVYTPGTDYTAAQEIRVETSAESGEEIEVGGPIEFAFPTITEPIIVAMTATLPVEMKGNCNFTNSVSLQSQDTYEYVSASAEIVYASSEADDPNPQDEQRAAVYVTGYTLPDGTPAFMDADGNYPEDAVSTVMPADGTMTWYVKVEAEEGSEYPLSDVSVRDEGGQYAINNWEVSGDIIAEQCLNYEDAYVIGENTGTTYTPGEDYSVRQEPGGVTDEGNQNGGPIEFTFPTISEPIIIAIPMALPVKIIGNYMINNRVSVQDFVTYRYIDASAEVTGEYNELVANLTGVYDEDSRIVTWKAILNPAKVAIEPVNDLVEFSAVIPEGMELVNFDDPMVGAVPTIRVQYQGNVWGEMFFDVTVTDGGIAPIDIRHYWEQTWFDPPEKAYDGNVSGTEYIVEYKTRITDEEWEQLAYVAGGLKTYTNSVMFTDGGEITLQEECCVAIEREVINPITFIEQPESCEHAIGEKVSLVAEAEGEGLAYQWQYLKPGADEWKNSGLSSAKNNVLTFKMSAGYDGMQFRCKVTDSDGKEAYSEAAAITMIDRSYITKQPEDVVTSIGTKAAFSIETDRDDLTYQWQYQKVGSTKWNNSTSAGNKTDSMKVSATAGTNGMKFRCVVTDAEGNVDVSEEALLTAVPKPEITVQPESVNAVIGKRVKLNVSATGTTDLTYQWQYQKPGTDTWKKSGLSSAALSTLSFKMSEAYDGYKFRCKVTDAYGASVYSDAAAIAIAE